MARWTAVILILWGLFTSCFNPETDVTAQGTALRLLVPLYSFPTDNDGQYWYDVAQAAEQVPVTVIWGMTVRSDSSIYKQWLKVLRTGENIELLSYVATTDGQRNIDSVKEEIRFYAENFDIDGIFLDEVNHSEPKFQYYRELVKYAKNFDRVRKVILNSSYAPEYFADTTGADAVIFFENLGKYWSDFDWETYQDLSAEKKAAIVSGVLFKKRMKTILEQAVERGFGYIFVTNRGYDKLPSYWQEEVQVVKAINVLQ